MRDDSCPIERFGRFRRRLRSAVTDLLEKKYELGMNTAEKITDNYFREGTLPNYYFSSNTPEEIAYHIFIITQLLNANTESIRQESLDGKKLIYFVNVGRDFPGKLIRVLEENSPFEIASFDSVKTRSGIRIVTLELSGRDDLSCGDAEKAAMEEVRARLRQCGHPWAERFLLSLPPNYLNEEILSVIRDHPRIVRHLEMFAGAMESDSAFVAIEEAEPDADRLGRDQRELRVGVSVRNRDSHFIVDILKIFERRGVNIHRSYFDTFTLPDTGECAAILSLYILNEETVLEGIEGEIRDLSLQARPSTLPEAARLERRLVGLVRSLSSEGTAERQREEALRSWAELVRANCDPAREDEHRNFLLNAVSDFYRAAEFLGIADCPSVMGRLLRFESLSEFFVSGQHGGQRKNLPGFRFAHSSVRGASKGGLRLDPIVQFDEVCALAFMMSFKTARSRILFGGAKGGLVIRPGDFIDSRLDFIDTLTNFGRSLFLVAGPVRDVPAGDVGCGSEEIGVLFEGFKSALRDLAMIACGIKKSATVIGNRVISLEEAREMLIRHFGLDYRDRGALQELISSEHYLDLIVAAQITGKPRMGIEARAGATGRGLLYSVLAMVARLYLDGRWETEEILTAAETDLLRKVAAIDEDLILKKGGRELLPDVSWRELDGRIFPKLLRDKKIVVQGTGNVGASVLRDFDRYGVNVVAVGDAGGAIIGERLDVGEMMREVSSSRNRSVVTARKRVVRVIAGAREGAAILEHPCDILIPCALENVIDAGVAQRLQAKIIACGGNGTNTAKAEEILHQRGIAVVYDFLANGGGVIVSYFEWLRNLTDRYRYEAEVINGRPFEIDVMNGHIMPEFRERLQAILQESESQGATEAWDGVLRDILFAAVNDDVNFSKTEGISMKTAGFVNATLRLMAADMARMAPGNRAAFWEDLPAKAREHLRRSLSHPEVLLFNPEIGRGEWAAC